MTERLPALTRREALAGAAAVAAVTQAPAALAQSAAETAETAHGTVFEDVDGTMRRGAKPRGVPDVLVSNGRDVVRTDASGQWSLPVQPGDSVFVIKPAGWATPVEADTMIPTFAYIHDPQGTPASLGLRYRGVPPSGKLPESIDFPLRRQKEPSRFDVILFTDPQPESAVELGFVRDDVVAQAAGTDAAFGITLGDVMFDDLSLYDRSNRIVGTIGLPWYHCCGNHDMNYEAPDNRRSRETFKRHFGARYYAWQYGGATFLALDNVEYLGNNKFRGFFGDDQLAFVRSLLAQLPQDQLIVACMHIPLRTVGGEDPEIATVNWKDFVALFAGRPNVMSFSGHTHTNEHHYLDAGDVRAHHHHVLTAVSGSWWSGPFDERGIPVALASDGTPNGFHVLTVDGSSCGTTLMAAHDPARGQMRLMLDGPFHRAGREVIREFRMGELLGGAMPVDAVYSTDLLVNLFDGGPRSTVEFSVGGDWRPMRRTARNDPFVQEVYIRNAATKKPWVEPTTCSHLWQARLPEGLPPGIHRIAVRARDEHGRAHTGGMIIEVLAA